MSEDYIYDTDGLNAKGERVICYRNKYTGREIQILYEDNSLDEHDAKIREDAIEEFIEWLYKRWDITFHEKQNMKDWFLKEQRSDSKG